MVGLGVGALLGAYMIKDLAHQSIDTTDILIGTFAVASNMAGLGAIGMSYGSKLVRDQIFDKVLDAEIAFRMYILRQ
jgi:hypothetical protein